MKFLLPLLVVLSPVVFAQDAPLRIGHITIENLDVYAPREAEKGWLYRAADRLHIETRQSVIATFLLFHEGDLYRPERLAETERNLRTLHFLKSASVVASPPHDGVVDVTVTTQDAWSIAPETQAGAKGGTSTYGASLSETNLVGWGKELEIGYQKGVDRRRIGLAYQDHAFFAPYWNAFVSYGRNSDGYDHRVDLQRPFYSFATPWSAGVSFQDFRQVDKLYALGENVSRFEQQHRMFVLSAGRAIGPNDFDANRITAGFRYAADDFTPTFTFEGTQTPNERDFHYIFTRFEHAENDFVKLNFVNKDMRYEDFNLGRQFSAEAAVSPTALRSDRNIAFAQITAADGFRLNDGFILPSALIQSRFGTGFENAIASTSLSLVERTDATFPRALVGRIAAQSGWRLDREVQFFADGLNGLRGYRAHAFEGSRAIVMNLEERIYLGRELLQLYSPGVVAFVDAGNATDGGFRHLMALKTDVGIGIRIGLPRTPKNLLRLDIAYALQRDARGRRGLQISMSSGQAF